jgi:uroporphyrinogen-III synthase
MKIPLFITNISNREAEFSTIGRALVAPRTIWSGTSHREFAALLRRENPEVVHVHNTFMMISPSIYSACRDHGVPVVQTLHNFRLLDHGLWKSVSHGCWPRLR